MGRLLRTIAHIYDAFDRLNISMSAKEYKKLLREESECLRNYFLTDSGIQTLLNFYFRVETSDFVEPAGRLHKEKGTFEFLPPDERTKQHLQAIITGDRKALENLEALVAGEVRRKKEFERYTGPAERLLTELEKKLRGGDDGPGLLYAYGHYSSGSYISANRGENEIEMHIHPRVYRRVGNPNGTKLEVGLPGYSAADIKVSAHMTLGLIEYSHFINNSGSEPKLIVYMRLYHRIGFWEEKVGDARLDVGLTNTSYKFGNSPEMTFKTPKIKMPVTQAVKFLGSSVYVLPFIDYDETQTPEEAAANDFSSFFNNVYTRQPLEEETTEKIMEIRNNYVNKALKDFDGLKKEIGAIIRIVWGLDYFKD